MNVSWSVARYSPDSDPKTAFHDLVVVDIKTDAVNMSGIILTPEQAEEMSKALSSAAVKARAAHVDRVCRP